MRTINRALGIVLLGLLGAVLVAAAVALLLPARAHAERSLVIEAPPATVFALVNGFELFPRWSPWHAADPGIEYRFEGPSHGVGATMSWHSESQVVGNGSQRIVASEPYRLVRIVYEFGERQSADAAFVVEPQGLGSRVTWSLDTDFGWNLVARYFGLAFDRMVGPDLELGLANLKTLAESLPDADWSDLAHVTSSRIHESELFGRPRTEPYRLIRLRLPPL